MDHLRNRGDVQFDFLGTCELRSRQASTINLRSCLERRARCIVPLRSQSSNRDQYDRMRWTRVRRATPVGPLASQGLASSFQAVPAMSRWIHGVSPVNSLMNMAPVMAPPPLPLPMFWMSATVP